MPGDYTFHLTGKIHGTLVDETATSSDATFDSVVDSSTVDFPTKLPSISDIVTRLDRIRRPNLGGTRGRRGSRGEYGPRSGRGRGRPLGAVRGRCSIGGRRIGPE